MPELNAPLIMAVFVAIGGSWIVYLNHFRSQRAGSDGRKRSKTLTWFRAVDVYLKISTIGVSISAIFFDHPILIEMHENHWLLFLGLGITAAGLALFVSAMRHLDRQYSPCYAARVPDEIVDTGPYRLVRHPVYSANILLLTGLLVATGSVWLLFNLTLLLGCYSYIVTIEERSLAAELPGYADYAARTGRFFPRVILRPRAGV